MTKSKFIVVEHDAKKARLHWDLRFIMPKSQLWMSFAVRKGIPLEAGKKVLAVRTHDHTKDEALFLGKLESGYGAGTLKKWDDGDCIIHKFKPGHILIEFKGKKVKGFYHLINTGVMNRKEYKSQQYMLFKGKSLNEWSGLCSGTFWEDLEGDENSEESKKLPWSKKKTKVGKQED
jgi:DNA ligase D-like protein (predicted 3'-phosphoesterase)